MVLTGRNRFAVVDRQEGKRYDRIVGRSLIFSSDNRWLAYVARAGGHRFVVGDGQDGEHYDSIDERSLVISPDSQRVAYAALGSERRLVFKVSQR